MCVYVYVCGGGGLGGDEPLTFTIIKKKKGLTGVKRKGCSKNCSRIH